MKRWQQTALGVGTAAVVLVGWFWWWSQPSVQVPRAFAAIAAAMRDGDARDVMARIHRDYRWAEQWPTIYSHREMLGEGADPAPGEDPDRALALSGLRRLFLFHLQNPLQFTWRVVDLKQVGEVIEARVDIGLTSAGGGLATIDPPIHGVRFRLKRASWWPALFISGHDAIAGPRLP